MEYNIHKICRVCLDEGALTSIYSTEFAMMPCAMMMMCAKIRVFKTDGLPAVICNNCIYRLGVAYHFKQECENSDIRLRQYLGLPGGGYSYCDAETNTDLEIQSTIYQSQPLNINNTSDDDEAQQCEVIKKYKRRSRYQRKQPEDHKKRGPKPLPKLPQTCYECNKTFKCAAQLQQHVRTHTGEKPFGCTYCDRRFAQKYNLQVHERTHTGDKPFQCEICSKQFSALGNFQAHQKIHVGIRDQLCPVCQKSFYSAGDLTKHMVTHTGLKNHHCEVCGKAFSRQRDMQAHKRKLHQLLQRDVARDVEDDDDADEAIDTDPVGVDTLSNDNFKCPDCDKAFESADHLSFHFRTHATNNNLLNLPLATTPQMTHHHHHHHPHHYHHPPPHHDGLHHLSLNAPPPPMHSTLQANATQVGMASMAHHMLAPPPPPPPPPTTHNEQSRLSMMHHSAQRLHY